MTSNELAETGNEGTPGPDSIAKNTVFSLVTQLTTASLTAVLTLFLVRGLGPREFGLFALALSVNGIALTLADLGITSSTSRFIAEHRDRRDLVGAFFVDGLKLKLMLAGTVCAALALLAPVIADVYRQPGLTWPLRAMALATLGQSVLLLLLTATSALGRIASNLRLVAFESLVEVSASIALVVLGAGAAGAAFGRSIGYVCGACVGVALVLRLTGRPRLALHRAPARASARRLGSYASGLFVVDVAYTLINSIPVLLVNAYLGSAATGVFTAPMRILILLQYVGLAAANGVAPRLARRRGRGPDVRALRAAIRGLIIFQCFLVAPAIVWAEPITRLLLGEGYGRAAPVLTALAPYIFFGGFAAILSVSVNYFGEAMRRIPIAIGAAILATASSMILIPSHGLVGAAIATDIAFGSYTLAHLWLCRHLFGLRLIPLGPTLGRALLAATAMALMLWVLGTDELSTLDWFVGGVGGTAMFMAVIVLSGEVRADELARALGRLQRVFRPASGG